MPSPINLNQMPLKSRMRVNEAAITDTRRRVAGHSRQIAGLDERLRTAEEHIGKQPKTVLNDQMLVAIQKVIADVDTFRKAGLTNERIEMLVKAKLDSFEQFVDRLTAVETAVYEFHGPEIAQLRTDVDELKEDHSVSEYTASQAFALASSSAYSVHRLAGSLGKAMRQAAITVIGMMVVASLLMWLWIAQRSWDAPSPHEIGAIAIAAAFGGLLGLILASFEVAEVDDPTVIAEANATAFLDQKRQRTERRQAQKSQDTPVTISQEEIDALRADSSAGAVVTDDGSGPFVSARTSGRY